MSDSAKQTTIAILAEYHAIASAADERAKVGEARAKRMAELAVLARTNPEEAQHQKRQLDMMPFVHDFGDTLSALRRTMRKSAKALKGSPNVDTKTTRPLPSTVAAYRAIGRAMVLYEVPGATSEEVFAEIKIARNLLKESIYGKA